MSSSVSTPLDQQVLVLSIGQIHYVEELELEVGFSENRVLQKETKYVPSMADADKLFTQADTDILTMEQTLILEITYCQFRIARFASRCDSSYSFFFEPTTEITTHEDTTGFRYYKPVREAFSSGLPLKFSRCTKGMLALLFRYGGVYIALALGLINTVYPVYNSRKDHDKIYTVIHNIEDELATAVNDKKNETEISKIRTTLYMQMFKTREGRAVGQIKNYIDTAPVRHNTDGYTHKIVLVYGEAHDFEPYFRDSVYNYKHLSFGAAHHDQHATRVAELRNEATDAKLKL